MNLAVDIAGIGLMAPGLPSWGEAQAVLRGDQPWQAGELPLAKPASLNPGELRRLPAQVKLAVAVAEAACADAGMAASELPTVFASGQGDLATTDYMCKTLARAPAAMSPTKFHNSVHNAASGHWSIASGCRAASTAVSSEQFSFAAGLHQAAVQVLADDTPVLLVAYDTASAAHGLVGELRPMAQPFALALVLAPGGARLSLQQGPAKADSACFNASLETLRAQNFIARSLPVLESLAAGSSRTVDLALSTGLSLRVGLTTP